MTQTVRVQSVPGEWEETVGRKSVPYSSQSPRRMGEVSDACEQRGQ